MQVKKFEAPTLQEALDTIKRELGPEAIILQTKKYKRGFGLMSKPSVEVTAAVSDRSLQKKKYVETRLPEPAKESVKKISAERQAELYNKFVDKHLAAAEKTKDQVVLGKKLTTTRYIDIQDPDQKANATNRASQVQAPKRGNNMSLEDEIQHLKRMLQEVKSSQDAANISAFGSGAQALMGQATLGTQALQDTFEQLVIGGMDKRFAFSLVKKAAFELGNEKSKDSESVLDQVATEIIESTEVMSPLIGINPQNTETSASGPVVIALVGPTGVGKTTTVAKIASEALLKRNLKVGLINVDNYKIAAFDQLGTYAKILNVPFRSANTAEDIQAALNDFRSLDLVLIDTTGRSQRDMDSLKEMRAMLESVQDLRCQLVLSATTRDAELYDMASRFAVFRPQGMIISKLDEATLYGSIYNVSQKVKLPLLYFTTGQRVPEDIEEATRERVVSLILDL